MNEVVRQALIQLAKEKFFEGEIAKLEAAALERLLQESTASKAVEVFKETFAEFSSQRYALQTLCELAKKVLRESMLAVQN